MFSKTTLDLGLVLLVGLGACRQDRAEPSIPPDDAAPVASVAQETKASMDAEAEPSVPRVPGDAVVQRIVELGTTQPQVGEHLRELTETIGHRLTSSHNLMAAERWTRDRFAGWGLKARLEQWGEFPVGFDRGPSSGRMVAPKEVELDFTTPSWTPGVYGPKRGVARLAPASPREVKRDPKSFEGVWILEPPRSEDERSEERKEDLREALREAGVAGFVHRARSDEGLVHTFGNYRISWDDLPEDVEVVLRADQYDDIAKRVKQSEEVELEFSIDNRFFNGPVPQHNVIADLVGSKYPDEYVVVGGHLDSWDGADGVNDNGTGVATTLEAARLLVEAGARPARTIRFMLWTGEEQGLLGSRAYVEQHPEEMKKISAVLVHDGGTNYLSGLAVTPEMMPMMKKVFEPVMALSEEMPFELHYAEGLMTGGSDHTPFIRAGVPGFFWNQSGESDYDHVHHTQHDVLENARPEYQKHSAMVVAIGAYNLANAETMLDRTNASPIAWRRMNVDLDGLVVTEVEPKGMAAKAGWKKGDEILKVDGKPVAKMMELFMALQKGDAKKKVELRRDGKVIETVLDYSDLPEEKERAERRKAREAAGLWPPPEEK